MMNSLREVAVKRDALILEEREKDAAKAAEAAAAAKAEPAPALPPAE
jgi:DNA-directed RNA polymerase subunit beta'